MTVIRIAKTSGSIGSVLAPPLSMGSRFGAEDPLPRDKCSIIEGDPHLRSSSTLEAFHIRATDGAIGHIEEFLVDVAKGQVRFIVVDIRDWWPGHRVVIPHAAVRAIDYASCKVVLSLSCDRVRSAQPWVPNATSHGAYDDHVPVR